MRTALFVSLTLTLGLCGTAEAQGLRKECQVATVCAGVKSGGGRIIACLKSHQSELSQACLAAIDAFEAKAAAKAAKQPAPEAAAPRGPRPARRRPTRRNPMRPADLLPTNAGTRARPPGMTKGGIAPGRFGLGARVAAGARKINPPRARRRGFPPRGLSKAFVYLFPINFVFRANHAFVSSGGCRCPGSTLRSRMIGRRRTKPPRPSFGKPKRAPRSRRTGDPRAQSLHRPGDRGRRNCDRRGGAVRVGAAST